MCHAKFSMGSGKTFTSGTVRETPLKAIIYQQQYTIAHDSSSPWIEPNDVELVADDLLIEASEPILNDEINARFTGASYSSE